MDETWIDRQEAEEAAKLKVPFNSVTFPKRFWQDNKIIRYRVFDGPRESKVVTAQTAAMAVVLSGIKKPTKVERYILEYELEVDDQQLTEDIDMYERPIMEAISQGNPVLSSKILNGVMEASDELLGGGHKEAAEEAPIAPAAAPAADNTATAPTPEAAAADAAAQEGDDATEEDAEGDELDEALQAPSLKDIMSSGGDDGDLMSNGDDEEADSAAPPPSDG